MKFKYFDHTADAMFESYGKTIEEAFENSALAMFNLITDINKVKAVKKYQVRIKADKLEKLLFDFFDDLLFHLDTEHIIASKYENMKIAKKGKFFELNCSVSGDIASKYDRHGDIKAPTYNEMSIKETKEGFVIKAVVDI